MIYRRFFTTSCAAIALVTAWSGATIPAAAAPTAEEAATAATIAKRADKVVARLGLTDTEQAARVRELIVQQSHSLREIHAARDAKIAEATKSPGADPAVRSAWVGVAKANANLKLLQLHRRFVARLAAELTPEQVDQVKDDLTYDDVQITYDRYLQLLPNLTDEQQREIMANLLEAREYAMDAGSADEMRAIFGQYKGKINDYLSKAGYDLKQAEKDLAAREKARGQQDSQ